MIDRIPTDYNTVVALWQRGMNTDEIAKHIGVKEPLVDRWVGWHLDAKAAMKGNAHGE